MDTESRIEAALERAVAKATEAPCPAQLAKAIRYSVFPGGGRVRPGLCLAIARACGDQISALADAGAAAVELLHCASLVQDDLPCFDDAATRRGQPSVHARFGEEIAILVGDALIVMAFSEVTACVPAHSAQSAAVLEALARAAGAPAGIAAGQAWESEPHIDIAVYHQAKTAALFEAAAVSGAVAGGVETAPWRPVGRLLGEAYQIADDLADALGESRRLGKPIHQDGSKARPSAVSKLGVERASQMLDDLLNRAALALPDCPGRHSVEEFLRRTAVRLCPPEVRGRIATENWALGRG
jgi:geranylgeranyl diphosphate synthase type II